MLSNRTIITLAIAGLVLPVLIVLFRQSNIGLIAAPITCEQITTRLSAIDNVARLPESPVLIIGDATARHWPASITTLNEQPVLVRAFSGLTTDLADMCFERLVAFYRPGRVLLFLESADQEKLETELTDDLRSLRSTFTRYGISGELTVVGLAKTPARDNARIGRLNQAVEELAFNIRGLHFIDLNPLLLNAEGAPDPRKFWPDGDTLSADEYPALAALIARQVKRPRNSNDQV
jgi:hypothetical protein